MCRETDINGKFPGWNIKTLDDKTFEESERDEEIVKKRVSQQFSVLVETLGTSQMDIDLKKIVEIFYVKLHKKNKKVDVMNCEKLLGRIKNRQFDVVHMLTKSLSSEPEESVVVSTKALQKQCILLSPCLSITCPPAPVDFPCQIAIAVGITLPKDEGKVEERKEKDKSKKTVTEKDETKMKRVDFQSCGSALDFVCPRKSNGIEINNPWAASYHAAAVVILILIKAYALG